MKLTKKLKKQLEASKFELLEANKYLEANEPKLVQMAIDVAIGWLDYALGERKWKKEIDIEFKWSILLEG